MYGQSSIEPSLRHSYCSIYPQKHTIVEGPTVFQLSARGSLEKMFTSFVVHNLELLFSVHLPPTGCIGLTRQCFLHGRSFKIQLNLC